MAESSAYGLGCPSSEGRRRVTRRGRSEAKETRSGLTRRRHSDTPAPYNPSGNDRSVREIRPNGARNNPGNQRSDNPKNNTAHHARQLPILAPPAEDQVRVHVMTARHHRNRNPGLVALRNDLALPRLAPPAATTANPAIDPRTRMLGCVRHPHSVHLSFVGTYDAPTTEREISPIPRKSDRRPTPKAYLATIASRSIVFRNAGRTIVPESSSVPGSNKVTLFLASARTTLGRPGS